MKKELFKELNAHIREQDTKSFALAVAYTATAAYITSEHNLREELSLIFRHSFHNEGDAELYSHEVALSAALLLGYIVFFILLWYRNWKVHYLDVCYKLWCEEKKEFGENVPIWLRQPPEFRSLDVITRSVPLFITTFQVVRLGMVICGDVQKYPIEYIIEIILMVVCHLAIMYVIFLTVENCKLKA